MTFSSYQNHNALREAADRYTQMYGGQFCRAECGDFLIYRDRDGNAYIPLEDSYTGSLLVKRLLQATKRKYAVDLLTLWWMPIDEFELRDIPGFCQHIHRLRTQGDHAHPLKRNRGGADLAL